jgi:hypothetical protein
VNADDPEDSPAYRPVLYTNDLIRITSTFVQGLLTVAPPERVRAALEAILSNWDDRVKMTMDLREQFERNFAQQGQSAQRKGPVS